MNRRQVRKHAIANAAVRLVDSITGDLAASTVKSFTELFSLAIGVDLKAPRPIDERIARLDEARAALAEGLNAIDELRDDANRAKEEHARVVSSLETALANRDDAEKKLEAVRNIINQDVTTFQEIAGVTDVRKERLFGFISGICASVVASAIWSWWPTLIEILKRR